MITISFGGTEIVVRPKSVLDYCEKLDFIKSRRQQPYDMVKDFPVEKGKAGAEGAQMLVRIAMETVYTRSSSVSIEEEIEFDKCWEGFYYNMWRCIRTNPNEKPKDGITRAKQLFEKATPEEVVQLRLAFEATDEANNLKNSDGPSVTNQTPGNQE